MKMDKEWILKHKFWLLLGAVGVLWLTALTALFAFSGDPIGDKKKAFEDADNAVKPYTNNTGAAKPKNDNFLPPWNNYGATFRNHKNTVWNIAWSGDEMDRVDADFKDKPPEDAKVLARHLFRNGSWEVTLLFDRNDKGAWRIRPDSTIKNVDGGHHDLDLTTPGIAVPADGVWFRLRQDQISVVAVSAWDRPELTRFAFMGKPVPWNQERNFQEGEQKEGWTLDAGDPMQPTDPKQPMQLQQIVAYPWRGQGDMYTWPDDERLPNGKPGARDHLLNQVLLNAAAPFATGLRDWYKGPDKESSPYWQQYRDLFKELSEPSLPNLPLDAVAFKGTDPAKREENYYSVLNPIDVNAPTVTTAPDVEECWLLQEDFWVKRELLYVVRDAMNLAAHLDPGSADPTAPAPPADAHVFHNASWQVTLLFDQNGTDQDGKPNQSWRIRPDSTIKNVHASHRDLDLGTPAAHNGGVWFRLRQGNNLWAIAFEGERLPWNQERTLAEGTYKDGESLRGNLDLTQPMELDQLFDATNSPITQIDEIAISKVSHRNANRQLVAAKLERYGIKPPPPPAGGTPAAPPGGGAAGGTAGAPAMSMAGAGAGGGGSGAGQPGAATAAASSKTSNYGIEKNRYLFVTDQSRHLPVAVTLTMDQSHLHEVLAAFANSKLRFQTTQVEFRRVPAAAPAASSTQPNGPGTQNPNPGGTTLPPMGPGALAPPSAGPPPGGTSGPAGNPNGGKFASFNGGGFPGVNGGGFPGNTGTIAPTVLADNPNLIEVTIYGIASLYERPGTTVKGRVKVAAKDKITITGDDNKDVELSVAPDARVMIDAKDGKAEEIKVGSTVTAVVAGDKVARIDAVSPK